MGVTISSSLRLNECDFSAKVLVGVDSTEAAQKLQGIANLSTHQLYVGDHLQVEAFFSLAIELLGNVDIIVANAIRADVQDWFSPDNKTPTSAHRLCSPHSTANDIIRRPA